MRAQIRWGVLAAATLSAMLAAPAPALAQKAKASAPGEAQILVTEANLPDAYSVVGALVVTVHPKSLSPKTPTRDLLDAELRKQAAKIGADAVIQVRYTLRNPMMSDKGSDAMGVAVKFNRVAAVPAPPSPAPSFAPKPAAVASAPQVAAISPPPAPTPGSAAGFAPPVAAQAIAAAPAPAPAAPPPASRPTQVAAAPVGPPQQVASAAAVAALPVAAAPVAAAPVAAAPVAASSVAAASVAAPAPPVVRHATSLDMIVVTEQDFAGRRYARVGEIRSEVHQKSLFPKTSAKDLLTADLRTQALKLGADAVLQVKYDMHNALTSTQGDIATGVAVRFE